MKGNYRVTTALAGQKEMEQTVDQFYTYHKQSNIGTKEHRMAQLPLGNVVKKWFQAQAQLLL